LSRPTDTERGARLAYDIAVDRLQDMFPADGLDRSFWDGIADEASVTIAECGFLRRAQVHARAGEVVGG